MQTHIFEDRPLTFEHATLDPASPSHAQSAKAPSKGVPEIRMSESTPPPAVKEAQCRHSQIPSVCNRINAALNWPLTFEHAALDPTSPSRTNGEARVEESI